MSNHQDIDQKLKGEFTMKSRIIAAIMALMFMTFATAGIYAQTPKGDMNRKGMMKDHMMGRNMMQGKIFEKLNLTDAQKDQISKLRTDFQTKMVDLKANLQKDMINLKALRNKDDITRDEVVTSVEALNKDKNAMALATANHLMDIREIFTPDQRKIAKKYLPEIMNSMRKHRSMRNFGWNGPGNK